MRHCSHYCSEGTCISPWNVCLFRTKLWLWYMVLLWTTCVFDLHPRYTNASSAAATFYISEGLPKGSFVGSLSHIAFDTVLLVYPADDLQVDTAKKIITTNAVLDREKYETYSIALMESSSGAVPSVVVNVTDANDNTPAFSRAVYNLEFYEGRNVLRTLKAVDSDFGSNSTQQYTILSGNIGNVFALNRFTDRNGLVCANLVLAPGKELDRETRDSYLLNISARDGGNPPRRNFTQLNITVGDVNDNRPIFANRSYSANTTENSPVGTPIVKVFASDEDIGVNAQVLYSIDRGSHSDPQRVFSIDPNTGVIVNTRKLDYESIREYKIYVRAENAGAPFLNDVVPVTIHVLDENDNPPDIRIEFAIYDTYQVLENASIGTTVARIYVSDKDSGINGEVDVTIEGGNGHFSLRSDPANHVDIIAVAKELDRETQASYKVRIFAKDRGQPQLVSQDGFIANVGDVNDNSPKFDQSVFTAVLSENATIGTSVLVARATDRDAGSNAKLTYNITYPPESSLYSTWFQINTLTGEIKTMAFLDREKVQRAVIFVTVTDSGVPPLSANCTVVINISDTNDNDPVFTKAVYLASVDENTANGTQVTQVSAKDIDSGLNGLVHYSLEVSQQDIPFAVNRSTGVVTTSGPIDYELHSSYHVKVLATDGGGRVSRSDLNISVVDINDNYPVISPASYNVTVYENVTVSDTLVTVIASDADSGVFSRLTFAFSSGNDDGQFYIDSSTGVVTLLKPLDRETEDFHQFEVEVTDGGGLKSKYSAVVRVIVLDVNDEPPVFEPSFYNFTITENSELQTVLGSVHASSKDLGTNADIYYSVKGGNVDNVFTINSTGTIFTQGNIDHEKTPHLLVNIEAMDGGTPPLFGFANVSVTVIDLNDNSPLFSSSEIHVNILEDTKVGQVFYNVTANDSDSGIFGQVHYTLLSNPNNTFKLDSSTGALSLTHTIDFEGSRQYTIQVLAEDGGSPSLNATATFKLTVVDVNDHPPRFLNSSYVAHVSEGEVGRTDILNVLATDADTGDNARILYSFQPGVDTTLFGIRPDGWIYIKQALDREQNAVYQFRVVATDQGTPPKSSTADVTVYVEDINDSSPRFTLPSYFFQVSEDASNRTRVGQVSATDSDAGSNAKISYTFESPSQQFVIDHDTGVIRTNQVLDRETQASYVMTVVASDHGVSPRKDKTSITVRVDDLNDNKPTFRKLSYEKAVSENIPVGSFVIKVIADDPDEGSNGDISYYTASGHVHSDITMFSVDAQTGDITTAARLDREKKDRYTLYIVAKDHGSPPNDNIVTVIIHVLDVNDNPPRFVNNSFFVNVQEKLPVGTVVTTVTAKDIDAGNNGEVRYTIDQGNSGSVFQINETSGVITLQKQLDFERKNKYQLRVVARDQGQNSRSSFLYVTVYVLDSNDNRPTFDKNPVTVSLLEGVPKNHNVTQIIAHDYDSGQNSWIRYSIDSQSPGPPKFKVDPSTGVVQTIGEIDRESVDEYTLNIRATDQAFTESERLSSTITLFIIVLDVNDNKPDFVSPNYTFVMEDEPFSYPIITITAIDQDSGDNARVRYRIEHGDNGEFGLDPDTGLLKLNRGLDYETKPKYILNISATDRGSPALSSYQLLTIYLVDVNDNAPQFNQSLYLGDVKENVPVGTPVMQISAYDADSGSNGALIYSIPRGAVKSNFAIDRNSGVISTNSTLDREEKDEYFLTVYATDNAFPFQVATCTVKITVLDQNDHAPTFNPTRLNLTVMENRAPHMFHVLTAQDPDMGQNGRLRYVIRSGNVDGKFDIDEFTGALSTTASLDRERKARYNLEIEASDLASPFYNSSAFVTIFVGDENDETPRFLKSSYDVSIRELIHVNSAILNVTATDSDLGLNGQVVYSLSNKTFGIFRIDSKTGVIYTLQEFDFSVKQEYVFNCYATDRGVVPRQASAEVKISIIDENNHAPVFEMLPYRFEAQSVSAGQLLVTVSSTDGDSAAITHLTYRLVNSSSQPYFELSSNSGELRVKQGVSNVPNGAYILNIFADDGNFTGRGIVEIFVGSITGAQPTFLNSTPAFVSLAENSPRNQEVTRVLATSGGSDAITYSIVDGNSGNAFYIHPQSGVLTVANPSQLDFERLRSIRLHIIASLATSRNAYLTLYVNLTNVNDNKPVFYPANNSVQLQEDNSLLSGGFVARTVATVTATDKDSGNTERITYELTAGNVNRKFDINSQTGVISTQGSIDREEHSFYQLVVKATDQGSPPLSSFSHVFVTIIDVNDNIPAFTGPYTVDVDEDLKVGSVVKRVVAVDRDENPNLVYSFSNGAFSQSVFNIDGFTGDVTLRKSLDYELKRTHLLYINVTDGTYQSQTTLTVNVNDVNDNAPRFLNSSYQATLSEETAAGTSILQVSAEDRDSSTNGQLSYAFVSSVDEFRINATSGVIYTAQKIQVSMRDSLLVIGVSATDHGVPPQRAFVAVQIRINRIPKFTEAAYEASIPEDTEPGTSVLTVKAAEDDSGVNVAKISYAIKFGNSQSLFRIGRRSGVIEVNNRGLDYEKSKSHLLGVEARDDSTNKSVVVRVNITITDVNDNSPVFDPDKYMKEVNEDISVGTTLLRVTASDEDSGTNGQVRYSIVSGNDKQSFEINSTSGEIVTIKSLDHESAKKHLLSVQAEDQGLNPKTRLASVTITVGDLNDNKPIFKIPHAGEVAVAENSPVGTPFYEVVAVDKDSAKNGAVKYSITGGSGYGLFVIKSTDKSTGMLSTNASFDYETRWLYVLEITAVDSGSPPLSNKINLTVYVKSVDESAPVFAKTSYSFSAVPGNAKIGYRVGFVNATDEDGGEDGVVRYKVFFSSKNVFGINETSGEIFVNDSLKEDSNKRRRRSIEDSKEQHLSRRVRRETGVTPVTLRIRAGSGKSDSKSDITSVYLDIDFTCPGCGSTEPQVDDKGTFARNIMIGLAVLAGVILIAFIVVIAALFMRKKKKRRNRQNRRLGFDGSFDEITVHPSPPNGNINHVDSSLENVSTPRGYSEECSPLNGPSDSPARGTDSSDTPNSASSGRGSSEGVDFEVDHPPILVNGDVGSLHSENYVKTAMGPDSGIQQDSDQVSQLTISDGSSMMHGEGLAIDKQSDKIDRRTFARMVSQESLHVFGEEGGGEADGGVDVGNLLYAKLSEVDADEDESIIDGMRPYIDEGHDHPSYGGSLSSIVGSREELTGSYNWDYLLDWGPQFQPLADVFLEIGKMKDENPPKKTMSLSLPSSRDSRNPPTGMVTTDMLSSVSSLPRSPISPPSTRFTSPAFSPNFTPAITPLVTRSPSVSPLDTGTSSPAFSPAAGTTPKSGSRPSSMHVLQLRRDSHDGSNSDLTHSPSISDNESNLEVDV